MADVPFGPSNILNLEAAGEAQSRGITIIFIEKTPSSERDFVGGRAELLLESIKSSGAKIAGSNQEVLTRLREIEEKLE